MPRSRVLIWPACAASLATSSSDAPAAARVTAATRPSTNGASDNTTGQSAASPRSSKASSALSTALPRSMRTSTPSRDATRSMASFTRAASVPSTWLSRPAATSIGGGVPRTICRASSTAASASRRLWDTTTMPTTACSSVVEHGGGGFEQQGGRRCAGILVADAALTEIARSTLAGHHRDGVVAAALRRLPRRWRTPRRRQPGADAASSASRAGCRLSNIVLSPSSGRPRATRPSTPAERP